MWRSFLIFNLIYCIVNAVTYNTYHGVPATEKEIAEFTEKNIAGICTVTFDECNETELRRPDGSCNNLNYPSHGAFNTLQHRMLPAEYGENNEPRLTKSGKPFPNARHIRQLMVTVGEGISDKLSTAGAYFIEFVTSDIGSIHDIQNFVLETPYCCEAEGKSDYMCTPDVVTSDDNVHKFSHIRCLNNTRPMTFQTTGCVSNDTVPARINYATSHFDLSSTYLFPKTSFSETRTFEGGRLKVETVNGGSFPSAANESTTCTILEAVKTGCTRNVPNSILGTNLFTTYFWRHHNVLADELAAQNPCWDDEKLFRVAYDINVAYYNHILFYEYLALILGKENLVKEGILQETPGFRDVYDETVPPQLTLEFNYALRWFHNTQDGQQRLYDKDYNYIRTFPMVNFTLRVQDLAVNGNMLGLTHGLIEQPSGDFDHTVHPEICENGLGQHQDAFDILTGDLSKGRYLGLPPYIKYRDFCTNYTISHKSFDDLSYILDESKMDILKLIYEDISDVELYSGIWSEKFIEGIMVPPTIYCMLVTHLKRSLITERHWYERPNRPNAFDNEQFNEITKASLAALFCSVGDEVSTIQPEAFRRPGPGNYKVSCDEIPKLDISKWQDSSCSSS